MIPISDETGLRTSSETQTFERSDLVDGERRTGDSPDDSGTGVPSNPALRSPFCITEASVDTIRGLLQVDNSPPAEIAFWSDFEPSLESCRDVVKNRALHDDPAVATTIVRIVSHLAVLEFRQGEARYTQVKEVICEEEKAVEGLLRTWGSLLGRANTKLERLSKCLDPFYEAMSESKGGRKDMWESNLFVGMLLELSLLIQWRMQSLAAEIQTLRDDGRHGYLLNHAERLFPFQCVCIGGGEVLSFLHLAM